MPDIFKPTQEQAQEAGAICGALLFGYLWSLQYEDEAKTLPFQPKAAKRYLTAKEAWELLGIGKTKFYEYVKEDDFPEPHPRSGKYLATDIERFDKKLKSKKA